jgi:hypothetical protein
MKMPPYLTLRTPDVTVWLPHGHGPQSATSKWCRSTECRHSPYPYPGSTNGAVTKGVAPCAPQHLRPYPHLTRPTLTPQFPLAQVPTTLSLQLERLWHPSQPTNWIMRVRLTSSTNQPTHTGVLTMAQHPTAPSVLACLPGQSNALSPRPH